MVENIVEEKNKNLQSENSATLVITHLLFGKNNEDEKILSDKSAIQYLSNTELSKNDLKQFFDFFKTFFETNKKIELITSELDNEKSRIFYSQNNVNGYTDTLNELATKRDKILKIQSYFLDIISSNKNLSTPLIDICINLSLKIIPLKDSKVMQQFGFDLLKALCKNSELNLTQEQIKQLAKTFTDNSEGKLAPDEITLFSGTLCSAFKKLFYSVNDDLAKIMLQWITKQNLMEDNQKSCIKALLEYGKTDRKKFLRMLIENNVLLATNKIVFEYLVTVLKDRTASSDFLEIMRENLKLSSELTTLFLEICVEISIEFSDENNKKFALEVIDALLKNENAEFTKIGLSKSGNIFFSWFSFPEKNSIGKLINALAIELKYSKKILTQKNILRTMINLMPDSDILVTEQEFIEKLPKYNINVAILCEILSTWTGIHYPVVSLTLQSIAKSLVDQTEISIFIKTIIDTNITLKNDADVIFTNKINILKCLIENNKLDNNNIQLIKTVGENLEKENGNHEKPKNYNLNFMPSENENITTNNRPQLCLKY